MKEKILYTLLLLSMLNYFSTAQSYTPFDFPNSLWEEAYYSMQHHRSYYNYFTNGDTVINNLVYQKLYKEGRYTITYNAPPQYVSWFSFSDLTGFIREDSNKRVYYQTINSGTENLLYDFNCSLGDTIAIPPINFIFDSAEVISIDTIFICSKMRKRYELAPIGTMLLDPLYWIEGIGSTHGLIPDYHWFEDGARNVCFSDGNCPSCPLILSNYNIVTQKAPKRAILYPNPTSENSYIQLSNGTMPTSIQVVNSLGQIVFSKTTINQKETIELNQCPAGIYSVRLEYENHKEIHYLIKN